MYIFDGRADWYIATSININMNCESCTKLWRRMHRCSGVMCCHLLEGRGFVRTLQCFFHKCFHVLEIDNYALFSINLCESSTYLFVNCSYRLDRSRVHIGHTHTPFIHTQLQRKTFVVWCTFGKCCCYRSQCTKQKMYEWSLKYNT